MHRKLILILCLSFFSTIALAQPKVIDKIVAQVGDNIILYSELSDPAAKADASKQLAKNFDSCSYLEELMYRCLLANQAELDSVVVSDEQVDSEMENRLRSIEAQMKGIKTEDGQPMSIEAYYGKTRTEIKEEFREIIRKRLKGQEVERGITKDLSVSPREVEEFFKNQPVDSIPFINTQLSFQQIVIFPVVTKNDKDLARRTLEDIRTEIVKENKNFGTMAKIHSMDPGSAREGGLIEASRGMMVKPFEQMAYSMKEGEVSPVFETEYGYHILKLLQMKGDDYVCQHILIVPEFSHDSLESAGRRVDECFHALKENRITWDEAVKKYSNDPNTKNNRGVLTNPITGEQLWDIEDVNQVDPQMFQLTDVLEKGEITTPTLYNDFMERKQGIRIVRLMDRTTPHKANLTDDYVLIMNAAEAEKKQKVVDQWISSKIKTAYIRIDDQYRTCKFRNNWTQ